LVGLYGSNYFYISPGPVLKEVNRDNFIVKGIAVDHSKEEYRGSGGKSPLIIL
jgi:hypothetical protein